MPDELIATFTQYDPPGRPAGMCWRCELWDASGDALFPLAVAYVGEYGPLGWSLDYIWVPEHFRRRGHATRLLRECDARWPDLVLTEAISAAGEGFLDAVCPEEVPGG